MIDDDADQQSYEMIRLQNMKRNEDFLQTLGLEDTRLERNLMTKQPKASRKGVTEKRGIKEKVAVVRRSSRVTAERLKVELEDAKKGNDTALIQAKEAELAEALQKKNEVSYESYIAETSNVEMKRLDPTPVALSSASDTEDITQLFGFIKLLENGPSRTLEANLKLTLDEYDSNKDYVNKIKSLSLTSEDIAKVTMSRIVSICFHPDPSKLLVIAGDKDGFAGLWDVDKLSHANMSADSRLSGGVSKRSNHPVYSTDDNNVGEEEEANAATVRNENGLYLFKPHVSNVSGIHCGQSLSHHIMSVSYDGTIRVLDANQQAFVLGFEAPESITDLYFSDAAFSANIPQTIFVGKSNGDVGVVDLRCSTSIYQSNFYSIQDTKINSIQFIPHSEERLILTAGAGSGGRIRIHDIRRIASTSLTASNIKGRSKGNATRESPKPNGITSSASTFSSNLVADFNFHVKSINAAMCSPDGKYIVSVSQDNTIKVHSHAGEPLHTRFLPVDASSSQSSASAPRGAQLAKDKILWNPEKGNTYSISHDNHTGRWLSTFRPVFDPKQPNTFMIGSMKPRPRIIELFSATSSGAVPTFDRFAYLIHDNLGSVCSRNAFHPSLNAIAGGNSSGRIHVFR